MLHHTNDACFCRVLSPLPHASHDFGRGRFVTPLCLAPAHVDHRYSPNYPEIPAPKAPTSDFIPPTRASLTDLHLQRPR